MWRLVEFLRFIFAISNLQPRQSSQDGRPPGRKSSNTSFDQDLDTAPEFLSISPTVDNDITTPIVPLSQRFFSKSPEEDVVAPLTRPRARTMNTVLVPDSRRARARLVPTVFKYARLHITNNNSDTQVYQEYPCWHCLPDRNHDWLEDCQDDKARRRKLLGEHPRY